MREKSSILIVDDNISLCKTLTYILKRKGHTVATAKDGLEAIEKVKETSFDLIFIDIKMPLMNGVETYKGIKKIRPNTIVIMMTAYSVDELIQEALKEGAYGILYKPLDIEKVLTIIKTAIEEKKGGLIMIVDDDTGFCTTLKNIQTKRSYSVGIAHSGEEAINKVKNKHYNVILIDMKLPTINGLETYLSIKKIDTEVVAIMLTGYQRELAEIVRESISSNAYTCLYKPLDIELLLELINNLLKGKKNSQKPAIKKTKEMEEYEKETGNYAIWNNKLTDGFLEWKKGEKIYDKNKERIS